MKVKWQTNSKYGGTGRCGGKSTLDAPGSKGHMGIPKSGSYPGKAKVSKGLDVPKKKGNKGVTLAKGFQSAKAPLD